MSNDLLPPGQPNRIILYNAADGKVTVNVFFARDNFWLPQRAIAELFGVGIAAISKHLKNIFESGELTPEATISKMETVQTEGDRQVSRVVEFYNLDAVIAVGYRVNSLKATHFRIWATNTLREFVVKGKLLLQRLAKRVVVIDDAVRCRSTLAELERVQRSTTATTTKTRDHDETINNNIDQ